MQPHLAKSDGCAAGVNVRGHLRLATAHGLSHSTNSAAACAPTHNAYAPCVTGACVRAAEGEGHSIRFICAHKTKRMQHATQRPLPPPPAGQLNACTAATAWRRAKWKYVISARLRLQPSRLLPAIHVVCSTEPFFLNKSATKDKSCSKVQRYHGVTTEAAAATNNDMQ